jgi:hypothetical protein
MDCGFSKRYLMHFLQSGIFCSLVELLFLLIFFFSNKKKNNKKKTNARIVIEI